MKCRSRSDVGLLAHKEEATQESPERMSTHIVGFLAIVKTHSHMTIFAGASDLTMMEGNLVGESARLPAFHTGGSYCDPIDGSAFYRLITSQIDKACLTEELAGPGDMFYLRKLVSISMLVALAVDLLQTVCRRRRAADQQQTYQVGSQSNPARTLYQRRDCLRCRTLSLSPSSSRR